MNSLAVALECEERGPEDRLDALRGSLACAGAAAREQVAVDFLEDDLLEAEAALDAVTRYVAEVGTALRLARGGRRVLMSLARDERAVDELDHLQGTIAGLRRRLVQIGVRLPA